MNAKTDAVEICSFGSGSEIPILLFHEGLGSVALWRDFPEKLAETTGHRVVAWSRKGYGNSGPFDGPYGLDFMHLEADAAAQLMTELAIERAHLFGHSDGASIALLLAARHPARVVSLILEAPHVFVEPICTAAITELKVGSAQLLHGLGKYHRDATAIFRQWFSIWTRPDFSSWNIEGALIDVVCPALLIQGEDDEYGTFEQLDRISARIADVRQLRLPNCGHSAHRDHEAAVLSASTAFLTEFAND